MMESGQMAIAFLILINIAAVAFSYGQVSATVKGLTARLERLEKLFNHSRGDK